MKNKLLPLGLLLVLFQIFLQSDLSQNPKVPAAQPSLIQKQPDEVIRKDFREIFLPNATSVGLLSPDANFINFDDVVNNTGFNSIEIAANRYPGVSFYDPYQYTSTWVTYAGSYSYPNSLIVGYICDTSTGNICSDYVLVVDFAVKSKDISFLWGRDSSYANGTIAVYEGNNYQLVATITVGLPGFWQSISLNQYSQQVRRLILRHPGQPPNVTGHIFIDNFQFTPVTTQSPVGTLESVSTTDHAALGWSADPDSPSASNSVDCYIDGQFISRVTA